MLLVWGGIGLVLTALLLAAWLMDRSVRRRGSQVTGGGRVWFDVRESRRDADVSTYAHGRDISWSSWSRRNRGS
ncbi:hypothetical protein GB931_04200 [Modestobacter sp. I12A-02628]|uniref:Uncharacterized protein n=1 Tax=Goekera deserti TaxID=2497753 RepID=A0A7K3WGA4_9ACTN|nr:hypothetical protein [Goekera deserti]MPQ97139.1 hypothetical protein [Goekera deserti]NDI46543.1 hypothetical protein [Goekera deserti]NEL54523.1 hypothetical protein [Goekera deserti]